MIIAETDRLTLQEISGRDLDDLKSVLADPEVMRYSLRGVCDEGQIRAYTKQCREQYGRSEPAQWAVFTKEEEELVGVCGLNKHPVDGEEFVHINYRLARKHWGKGYAAEAVGDVLSYARDKLLLDSVAAIIEPENMASAKVAKRAGFEFFQKSSFQGRKVDIYRVFL